ncbi:MAG: peptidoglycan-binding protein [Acidimicrobiaceae bacterium]|nr:peptidoglycan-binding domain-containing protein [Acidimicrobiaceae bacterium]MCY3642757.1 peptidoglycan-binding domain-containing protein [Acidimicrobiaceae bacterium]MDE0493478.1 peptidoglycan-binding domain-containing protein [Acidimicrobiaceae bacterium]MDE0493479.1 peptidoglycan-binding domain-containing protein [Acidimicrobiaceae bacterium]MDE0667251.1 peptidoglycan-binding domain-containing protein [Acidimicrobiaceae bacterium]
MRTHLQGAFLLIVLLLAFWWALSWAGPIFDSALGGADGAIVARAPTEEDAAAAQAAADEQPLDGNEVAALQAALLQVGYSPGPVDGIMGELTRAAIEEAKGDLGLLEASDRQLLETLGTAVEALESTPDAGEPGS